VAELLVNGWFVEGFRTGLLFLSKMSISTTKLSIDPTLNQDWYDDIGMKYRYRYATKLSAFERIHIKEDNLCCRAMGFERRRKK
jgi:hypothetical protein